MRGGMTAWGLVGLVLAVFLTSPAFGQSGTDGEVGYSIDASGPKPPPAGQAATAAPEPPAPPPKLSITLEGYEKTDEPPAPPESRSAPAQAPETAAPPAPADPEPQAASAPRTAPAQARPSPSPAAPPAVQPRQAVSPSRPSPVLSMLESTLGGNYANTRAIARNMPDRHFPGVRDKALARKLSKQGNDLLNKRDDPPAALDAYAAAYENDPSSSEISGSYGYALFRNGRFVEARDMEIECLEIAPEYAAAWFVLGQIYGYLRQEDMAFASFVNTCLFTRNINTSLGFLEREMKKYGEVTVQRAAGRALDACRRLTAGDLPARSSEAAPPGVAPAARETGPGTMDGTADAATRTGTGRTWGNARIGKVDIQAAILDSTLFQSMLAKVSTLPKAQVDAWLKAQLGPVVSALHGVIREYASANNYLLVIQTKDESTVRGGGPLGASLRAVVEDEGFVAYLDSPEGRAYRRTAPIQDLTPVVASRLKAR